MPNNGPEITENLPSIETGKTTPVKIDTSMPEGLQKILAQLEGHAKQ